MDLIVIDLHHSYSGHESVQPTVVLWFSDYFIFRFNVFLVIEIAVLFTVLFVHRRCNHWEIGLDDSLNTKSAFLVGKQRKPYSSW